MGYYTRFEITMEPTKELPTATPVGKYVAEFLGLLPESYDEDTIIDRLETISEYDFENGVNCWASEEIKWYNHETDMVQLSKEFPFVIFTVNGEGEESGDIWRAKVQAGMYKKQKAKIVFED